MGVTVLDGSTRVLHGRPSGSDLAWSAALAHLAGLRDQCEGIPPIPERCEGGQ